MVTAEVDRCRVGAPNCRWSAWSPLQIVFTLSKVFGNTSAEDAELHRMYSGGIFLVLPLQPDQMSVFYEEGQLQWNNCFRSDHKTLGYGVRFSFSLLCKMSFNLYNARTDGVN